jgi:uncharacterized membrane protein YhhN
MWWLRSTKIHGHSKVMNQPAIRTLYRPKNGILPFSASQSALLAVSIAAGLAYPIIEGRFGGALDIAAKGLGVASLAIIAALARHWWLAAIMAAGALGDVVLELPGGLVPGGAAFAVGHVMAIWLYRTARDVNASASRAGLAMALVIYGSIMPWFVLPAGSDIAAVTLYAVLLCTMAAAALLSRYPRRWLVTGALLFVVSDTLLIMRLGERLVGSAALHGALVWYSYYLGQLLIFMGVARGVRSQ